MKNWTAKLGASAVRLADDEDGGEIMEWVLIAGLIVVGTVVTIGTFGTKVLAKWTSVNNSM